MRKVLVGCAGWSIPAPYRDRFADGESVLARYASRFSVVEINSSFYRPHQPSTYARWAASVPRGFRFSVKMPKEISHELALRRCGPALDAFLAQSGALGSKLGGYLLQLPPGQVFEMRTASTFFRMFRRRTDAPLACEARNLSWFSPAASELFALHAVGRVDADPRVGDNDHEMDTRSAWPYWRWHGAPRIYYSAYSDEQLQALAASLRALPDARRPAWVIFDNTAHGFATANALRLQALLEGP
ncbi:DUF72 domain-containing protein [Pseudoxanthomonas daejeonensis]|uniref:DUF72 domain-containing protein n=1 Tax=Pseudoxanthomonas daejeonensis TaxID=266062 RepID=A0ABQ6ZAY0_9GAMM|nr:DUF72 domain-containing protein [Pseudoxanthomonas daejeonensis]KAF1697035.1 hypothetical protein CSC65_03110 [Pseudoxanthomonas daejeonensis]UNK56350.1 DUF72 domain-containing protein [Pseudoxanthomonas daejeonensis]